MTNNWTSSGSSAVSTELDGNRDDIVEQVWSRLSNVGQLLEAEDLREFTEETIQYVTGQLREIIIEIRNVPDKGIYMFALSRDAMLKYLRRGVIELYLALDEMEKKGRTSRFYKHLLNFQEYFEKTFEQKVHKTQDWKNIAPQLASIATKRHSANFFTQLWKHRDELTHIQEAIKYVSQVFIQESVQLTECKQSITVLCQINVLLDEKCILINRSLSVNQMAVMTTLLNYELMVTLCYACEQAKKLVSLLTTFCPLYRSKSKQALEVRQEIVNKLELLIQSNDDIIHKLQQIAFLCDQTRFQRQGTNND